MPCDYLEETPESRTKTERKKLQQQERQPEVLPETEMSTTDDDDNEDEDILQSFARYLINQQNRRVTEESDDTEVSAPTTGKTPCLPEHHTPKQILQKQKLDL